MSKESTTKSKRFGWLQNSWMVTLTSTIIGVVIGVLVADWWQQKVAKDHQQAAITAIQSEVEDNSKYVQGLIDTISLKLPQFQTVIGIVLENEGSIIIHRDSLKSFMRRTSSVFSFEKSEPISNDLIKLRGELEFKIASQSLMLMSGIRDINWRAFIASGYSSQTNFQCLVVLEDLYKIQGKVSAEFSQWFEQIYHIAGMGIDIEEMPSFIRTGEIVLLQLDMLHRLYTDKDFIFEEC